MRALFAALFVIISLFSNICLAGDTVSIVVSNSIGVRTASSSLIKYSDSTREFHIPGLTSSDSVRVDYSNDGTNWLTLYTFSGSQTTMFKATDRAAYYSTVRLAGSTSGLRLYVSMGFDPQATEKNTIRVPQAAVSATSATCFPMWGSTTKDETMLAVFYTPSASVAADATNYVTAAIKVYDGSGAADHTMLTWKMGFTGFALTANAFNASPTLTDAGVSTGYTVCVVFTVSGTGTLPSGVWEFLAL